MKPNVNWLLAFVPITLVLEHAHVPAPLIFLSAALSIIPIAAAIVHATEHLAHHTGDAIGGLLNATFGNAPELIIATVALRAGYVDMVRASIIGAIRRHGPHQGAQKSTSTGWSLPSTSV